MWVIALIWWKRPRLAQNLIAAWFITMGIVVTITAPGQLFLRAVDPASPQVQTWIPEWALWAGFGAGPLAVIVTCILLDRRAKA